MQLTFLSCDQHGVDLQVVIAARISIRVYVQMCIRRLFADNGIRIDFLAF